MADKAVFSSYHRPGPPMPRPSRMQLDDGAAAPSPPPGDAVTETSVFDTPTPSEETSSVVTDTVGADAIVVDTGPWADLTAVPVGSDQLGLINPAVITLRAKLPDSIAVVLEADTAGIYRPPGFRPAPWSGFAYDQPKNLLTGLGAGTRILTARGEVEVENLVPGDAAMTLRGPALLPIAWIGRANAAAPPIEIEPGALGPNIPRRMLCVGPDQAVFLKPVPVAAHTLVNGTTIRRTGDTTPELFHIDVGRAEVIFAEGLALSSSHGASSRA